MHTKLQTKEGLEKMHAVYTGNPKLGDAKKVMEQLVEVRRSIDLLNVEMSRLKVSFYIYLLLFLAVGYWSDISLFFAN